MRLEFGSNDTKLTERTCEGHDAVVWLTTAIMSQRMMITTIGLRSIIPVRGMTRRNGSISGSVIRRSTYANWLSWLIGNQLNRERAITAR